GWQAEELPIVAPLGVRLVPDIGALLREVRPDVHHRAREALRALRTAVESRLRDLRLHRRRCVHDGLQRGLGLFEGALLAGGLSCLGGDDLGVRLTVRRPVVVTAIVGGLLTANIATFLCSYRIRRRLLRGCVCW